MAPSSVSQGGCWTCKDRKVSCDRRIPSCQKCARSGRACQGYGIRLSWPRPENKARHLVGPKVPGTTRSEPIKLARWVNVGFQDIELSQEMGQITGSQRLKGTRGSLPKYVSLVLRAMSGWLPASPTTAVGELFQYFEAIAIDALTTCDDDSRRFVGNIARLGLTDARDSSRAVLQALLALASLHRHGLQAEAIKLQASALSLLHKTAQAGLSRFDAVQHIAAGMLLCSFEIQGDAQTSGPWFWYICGAKRLLSVAEPTKGEPVPELKGLLNWLYYHSIVAQFSARHWRRSNNETKRKDRSDARKLLGPTDRAMLNTACLGKCTSMLLPALCELFEQLVPPSDPRYHNPEYRAQLADLERQLEAMSRDRPGCNKGVLVELYRLASLIYLERASHNFSGRSAKIDAWTDAALQLIASPSAPPCPGGASGGASPSPAPVICKHVFPLFILGCEARDDGRRAVVLDAMDRTVRRTRSRAMELLHGMLQAVWNQDDLLGFGVADDEDGRRTGGSARVDYITRIDTILSACESIPSFA